MKNAPRPNVLFAVADDASHMGVLGHRFVSTQHFDWVAEQGVLFTNAYTTNPKCAPSRASILTGMHTWQLQEAANHWNVFPGTFAVYPDLVEQAGYLVGFTGKGWGPGDWSRNRPRNPAGDEYNQHRLQPPDGSNISTTDYAANFADFLNHRQTEQPFCFWYGGREPHRRYNPGEGLRAGKKLSDVKVPAYLPDNDTVRSDLLDYASEIDWFDAQLGRMITLLRNLGELDNTVIIVTSDNGMPFPRVKGQMLDPDFRLPLAICWPDHIPGGRVSEDLVSFVDLAPTLLDIAGLPSHPQMVGHSMLPLLTCDASGVIEPERDRVYMGRERHDLGYQDDRAYPVRCIRKGHYLYVRNLRPDMWPAGNPETGFTNVDSSPTKTQILQLHEAGDDTFYQLAFGKHPAEELYDLNTDPDCLTNLIPSDQWNPIAHHLWADLRDTLEDTGDPRLLGHGDVFDHYEYVGDTHHSWRAYSEGTWQPQSY